MSTTVDVAIIGAGAAGLMAAATAGQRGKRVLVLDHAEKLAEKIRISGGGRCNFTNLNTRPENFVSSNPHFCKNALSHYTPKHFLDLVKKHGIAHHEKHKGQLFCDTSSEQIIQLLLAECAAGAVEIRHPCKVSEIRHHADSYTLETSSGQVQAQAIIIATGGLSIPKIGATAFGYQIAKQFAVPLLETKPGLVPLTFDSLDWQAFAPLSGLSLEVEVWLENENGKPKAHFLEDLLFTHRGLSGPAILQISSFWNPAEKLHINLLPKHNVASKLIAEKSSSKKTVNNILAQWMPQRLAEACLTTHGIAPPQRISECADKTLRALGTSLNHWTITPNGSEGYRKAEVTVGGVDTRALSPHSMECLHHKGLYFVGEVMDVTGWLGGYNFQWAWASGYAAGMSV
jgi:predicted Rossmann fold flavoprotein